MKINLREDQIETIRACLALLIEWHAGRIVRNAATTHLDGVDHFAHKMAKDRLAEVRDRIAEQVDTEERG
jgi:hypothetical protein